MSLSKVEKLSIVIPAHNEAGSIHQTVTSLFDKLQSENIEHEILVVNDNSKDNTLEVLTDLQKIIPSLVVYTNEGNNGFGFAVRYGLDRFTGDCVAIMMADLSDDPSDLVRFYRLMKEKKVNCVFGSRFIKGARRIDYPFFKMIINRMANTLIRIVFGIRYNDVTNAFKLYERETIIGLKPFISNHFNLTVELPLKAIVRGFSYVVIPNSWQNRKAGLSKLRIKEMGSRYFFIVLYCLIENFFSMGDYKKDNSQQLK